jgi:hypothetical protein
MSDGWKKSEEPRSQSEKTQNDLDCLREFKNLASLAEARSKENWSLRQEIALAKSRIGLLLVKIEQKGGVIDPEWFKELKDYANS